LPKRAFGLAFSFEKTPPSKSSKEAIRAGILFLSFMIVVVDRDNEAAENDAPQMPSL
jgi:hypothetical protein